MPAEFRSSIVPKLNKVAAFENRVNAYNHDQDVWLYQLKKRVNLLSEIEERKVIYGTVKLTKDPRIDKNCTIIVLEAGGVGEL